MPTVNRPGIKTKPKFRRDERGRFAAKPTLRAVTLAELEALHAEFDKNFPSEEPEVLPNVVLWAIVAVVVVLAVAFSLS